MKVWMCLPIGLLFLGFSYLNVWGHMNYNYALDNPQAVPYSGGAEGLIALVVGGWLTVIGLVALAVSAFTISCRWLYRAVHGH